MSGCVFSVPLQKVKIKIQNELTVHPSASLSINEDVKINFKQSNQCFNALKCQKIVKKFENYGAPPPPCLAADNLTADRRFCRHLSSFEHKSSKSVRHCLARVV